MAQKTSAAPRRGFKEFIRKFLVSLKRNPQNIAMVSLAAAFLVYSLNLTSIANTTAKVNLSNMGQCEFACMLFSILAFVCFLRAFPKRQKANKVMIALVFFMMAILIFVDVVYYSRIIEAVSSGRIAITSDTAYIAVAQNIVVVHIILVAATAILLATLPVYSKLLKSINTSIDVDDNGELGEIDISGED